MSGWNVVFTAALEHRAAEVVPGPLVEARKQATRGGWNDRDAGIAAGER